MSAATAQESLTIHDNFLLMALRLTFGGSPCPNLWGCLSESITDLSNKLIQNNYWNHTKLFDPLVNSLNKPDSLPADIPFAQTKSLSISIPINNIGKSDVFIDDIIAISLDKDDNISRVCSAVLLAIHTVARPLDSQDEIPRKEIISLKKFQAEGSPSEQKVVLGWHLDTRSLRIHLPKHKFSEWNKEINSCLAQSKVDKRTMETLVGRLDHVAYIMDMLRHFMNRLRHALQRAIKCRITSLSSIEKEDLKLIQQFLVIATNKGVSLNNLSFRNPSIVYRSDACLHGLGGYNIITGEAWRWELPISLRNRTSLNSLEFIAILINIWIDYINGNILPESCILSQSDSTSASGWLKKSNFCDKDDVFIQLTTARQIATIILESESCLYSQWFPGEFNDVSDACSRDFHLSDIEITNLILSSIPNQVPNGFRISNPPQEIVSWLTSLLQSQPQKQEWNQQQTRGKLSRGLDSNPTSNQSQSPPIPISTVSQASKESKFWELLPMLSEKEGSTKTKSSPQGQNPFEPPLIAWHRPTGWPIDQIPVSTETENLHSFYNVKSEGIKS